jgi:drug/metabolite transporter (DMT)-like permease
MRNSPVLVYSLLLSVIIIWSLAWPISKIGLYDMPPMWFSSLRLWTGFLAIIIILAFQKQLKLPSRKDLPLILSIGLLQMACFLLLINGGLFFVDAGRSAILVYSTPFIVTPIAVLFFGEKLTKAKILGLILGLLGLLLLFAPWAFNWHNQKVLFGNVLLLLAAVCWAIAMLHTRYGKWHRPSIQLIPWQLLIASVSVLLVSIILSPHPEIHWTKRLWAAGLFNGLFATAFAYAAIIYVSQRLPVVNTSLLLLAVPVLGLFSSALWLGEQITIDKIAALLFIMSGLVIIALQND